MQKKTFFQAFGRIVRGYYPALSVEITRECPLRCPGCYAYELGHLGQLGPLRALADRKGPQLIDGILALVRRYRPLHLSIVGGEPLVRFRELDVLLPLLSKRCVTVQLVTSAVREIPSAWNQIKNLELVVSIDGLQPDHDRRRAPATYERILKNIVGHSITVHCTVTRQMVGRAKYFEEFLSFWSSRPEPRKIWFSLFTPQVGMESEERLLPHEREGLLREFAELSAKFPKLYLPGPVLEGFRNPPPSPEECLFARTTLCITADLQSRITPCQFGGNPDCSQCGCIASAGLRAVSNYRLMGLFPMESIYHATNRIGRTVGKLLGSPT